MNYKNNDCDSVFTVHCLSACNEDILKILLTKGASINTADNSGNTILMTLAFRGDSLKVATLISLGADVNLQNQEGFTALSCAVQEGKKSVVNVLLSQSKNINTELKTKKFGTTAFKIACEKGEIEIAKRLLEAGADINAQEDFGTTALWDVLGNKEFLKFMLANGADPTIKNRIGFNVLDFAKRIYVPEDIQLILANAIGLPPDVVVTKDFNQATNKSSAISELTEVSSPELKI